jgi:hypothetical protein
MVADDRRRIKVSGVEELVACGSFATTAQYLSDIEELLLRYLGSSMRTSTVDD